MPHANAARYADKKDGTSVSPQAAAVKETGPLRLVAQAKKDGRAAFIFSCVSLLAVALVAVLLLNMSISSRQYYLVRLKNEEKGILQNNQVLRQDVEKDNVSQNLAARAVELGMVPLTTAAYLNVQDGTIRGEIKAARKEQRMEQNVPSPQLPHVGALKPEDKKPDSQEGLKDKPAVPPDPVTGGKIPAPQQRVSGS